jgi:hypothetical protein
VRNRLRRPSLIATSVAGPAPNRPAVPDQAMRAEIEKLVEEIKQSVGLLRRHL